MAMQWVHRSWGSSSIFLKIFHIGMIQDMRTNFAKADVDAEAQAQNEAEHAKWQAEMLCSRAT